MRRFTLGRGIRSIGLATAMLVVTAGIASAQLASENSTTAGSSCSGDDADGYCDFSVTQPIVNPTTFQSRYAWNVNSDTGVASTRDSSGGAQHNVSFTAASPGDYRLTINQSRVRALTRSSDVVGCDGAADTNGITGSSNVALSSGPLSIADPGSIGNGGGDEYVPFSQPATAIILRTSQGAVLTHNLTFTWSGNTRSNSCEASVRQGAQNGTTTGCDACG